jgi:hypothetical protein
MLCWTSDTAKNTSLITYHKEGKKQIPMWCCIDKIIISVSWSYYGQLWLVGLVPNSFMKRFCNDGELDSASNFHLKRFCNGYLITSAWPTYLCASAHAKLADCWSRRAACGVQAMVVPWIRMFIWYVKLEQTTWIRMVVGIAFLIPKHVLHS